MSRQDAPARCVGCGLRFRENALDETGLCAVCADEAGLGAQDIPQRELEKTRSR
jgi:hypothetical protein